MNISLVIPAHNEEKYIGACLAAAIKHSHGLLFEILVVNNQSNDRTEEIALTFPNVRVVSEPQKGLVFTRQRGFLEARGDILAYIDADTLMPEGWCEQIHKEFENNPRLALLSGPYSYFDVSAFQNLLVRLYYITSIPVYWLVGYMATGGNFAIRKDVLVKMKGFDTTISFYGEDTNIARRAHEFGKVKFKQGFTMATSGRRFAEQGFLSTAYTYVINFFSEVIRHRPATKEYNDFR